MNKSITILGCGWFGLPLAVKLRASGWQVKGTTTSPAKLPVLKQQGIVPYLVHLNSIETEFKEVLNSAVLLISIPPGLRRQPEEAYLEQMEHLAQAVSQSAVKFVVFISSTSVYPELNKAISDANDADTNSALYRAEQIFVQNPAFKTTVVRFAGLIGPGRHPGRFFAGKQNIPNGQAPVNLIHLDDCIGLVERILLLQKTELVCHAAAPSHPTRAQFYTAAAQQAGLPLPGFTDELTEWKTIDSGALATQLSYTFIHPDLMAWVQQAQAV